MWKWIAFDVVTLAVFAAAVDLWLLRQLRAGGAFARLVEVDALSAVPVTEPPAHDLFEQRLSGELWAGAGTELDECIGALRWAMNRVGKYGPNSASDPGDLLQSVESGAGAICDGMAALLRQALAAIGIPSRTIALSRNIFDPWDSHIAVEAKIDGKWALVDPTFNISFSNMNGEMLSAQEIKGYFLSGKLNDINVDFHGDVLYPVRRESYYIDIFPFFNNVGVLVDVAPHRLLRLPPLRYWFGAKLLYEKLPIESVAHLKFRERLYFVAVVLLPILILAALLMVVGLVLAAAVLLIV